MCIFIHVSIQECDLREKERERERAVSEQFQSGFRAVLGQFGFDCDGEGNK